MRAPRLSNCLAWARRKYRAEGGYIAYRWTEGGPRFYHCTGLINAQYRRPLYRYRIPWNILWHKGRIVRMRRES